MGFFMATSTSSQPMMPTQQRPTGVTILGALSILAGIGLFLAGIIFLLLSIGYAFGAIFSGFTGTGLGYLGYGLLFLIFGIITLAVGVGLLRLRTWALVLGLIIYISFVGIQFIPLAYGNAMTWYNWGVVVFFLFLFLYLLAVRKRFH